MVAGGEAANPTPTQVKQMEQNMDHVKLSVSQTPVKLLLRQTQTSLFREERAENLAIFEVVGDRTSRIVLEEFVDKRDVDQSWSTDNPDLTLPEADLDQLSVLMWDMTPGKTTQDPETDEIRLSCEHSVKTIC